MATFVSGVTIGIIVCWQLGLVILSIVPILAIAGAAYQYALAGVTAKEREAYTMAGSIAEQVGAVTTR